MIRFSAVMFAMAVAAVLAALPGTANAQKWYAKAVKSVEGRFTPAEAKPGQTITFSLTVELNEGYHTYPTAQPDKKAEKIVNIIEFPAPGTVIFVGETQDPKKFATKAEPALGIKELRYYSGTVIYTRKAVVSPKAKPGDVKVKLANFSLSVCDDSICYPEKIVPIEAALKVLDATPVPVEKAYAEEVQKALTGK